MSTLKNSVQLLGRLGKEAEIKTSSNGTAYCHITLVTNEYGVKKNGEQFEKSQWHKISVWGDLTKQLQRRGNKESLWLIQGTILYNQYENKNGDQHYTCEIRASRLMFLMESKALNKEKKESA